MEAGLTKGLLPPPTTAWARRTKRAATAASDVSEEESIAPSQDSYHAPAPDQHKPLHQDADRVPGYESPPSAETVGRFIRAIRRERAQNQKALSDGAQAIQTAYESSDPLASATTLKIVNRRI